jgi:hypothetical protein
LPRRGEAVNMRSVHNAVTDTLEDLDMEDSVRDRIGVDPLNPRRYVVLLKSKPNSLSHGKLVIEILDEPNDIPTVSVLANVNVSQRTMEKIMDTLMDNLSSPVS